MRAWTSFVLGSDLCLDTLVTNQSRSSIAADFLPPPAPLSAATASGVQASSAGPLFANQAQPGASGKARFRTGW